MCIPLITAFDKSSLRHDGLETTHTGETASVDEVTGS